MATPIINTNLGKVVTATGNIADDLSTLRPLLRNMLFSAYATDKVENAPIASFPDGADNVPVKSATFAITPVQDLHGYDSPWPAGGGKNLLPNTYTTTTINGVTFTVNADGTVDANGTATADTDFIMQTEPNFRALLTSGTNYIINGCPSGGSASTYFMRLNVAGISDTGAGANVNYTGQTLGNFSIRIANGYTANHLLFKPMLRLASVADATFAPYSNICPITGFTGAEITDAGVNLLDQTVFADYGTLESDGSYYIASPVPLRDVAIWSNIKGITGSLYLVMKYRYDSSSSVGLRFKIHYTDGTESIFYPTATLTETTISTPTSSSKTVKDIVGDFGSSAVKTWVNLAIYTEAITTYTPFVGTTHDITWSDEAGTVYGGTLEYLGGDAWRVTKNMESVDLGTLTWTKSSSGNNFYASISPFYDYGVDVTMLCSQYVNAGARGSSPYYGNDKEFTYFLRGLPSSPGEIYVHDEAYSDAVAFKTAMSGVQLVYELATPVVYDLTGEELATVLGTNNVFSNTGDVTELVYRADTALYIEKKLAE